MPVLEDVEKIKFLTTQGFEIRLLGRPAPSQTVLPHREFEVLPLPSVQSGVFYRF
jgi:hypothetical protein